MVNVALLVVAGATFLNSISVILLAVYARKKEKEIRKLKLEQDKMWKSTTENIWVSDQSRDKQIENLQKDLKDMYMERSVVRNISVPKKYFMTRTFNEKRGKKKELADYVAAVALKTIASELPEERTPEVIENVIIPKIKEKLNESCIRL
mgnify:CR=1 FL=1